MASPLKVKHSIIAVACASGLTSLSCQFQSFRYGTKFLRAVNYHATPRWFAQNLDVQFAYLARNYVSVNQNGLHRVLSGTWTASKPGVLISFDDGLYSNYEVAAPLLEKYGLTGWFFVPVGIVESCSNRRAADQETLARSRQIRCRLRKTVPGRYSCRGSTQAISPGST